MKKVMFLFASALLVSSSALYAQSELDAYKYSQTDLSGTARYVSMAGAFGALGGDISAMSSNPGGLAIYRSSEIVGTLGISVMDTKTNWTGLSTKENKTKFNFDNIAYVGYFPTANESGIMGWNVGFSYNRAKNYNRQYRMIGQNFSQGQGSLSDYIADQTSRAMINYNIPFKDLLYDGENPSTDPYANPDIPWISSLGYEAGMIMPGQDELNYVGPYNSVMSGTISDANLWVNERGGVDKYNFSFATNISNIAFVGATVAITDLNYHISTAYSEQFTSGDNLYLDNELKTEGTGYGFNIGVIFRPADFLRLGVAYNTKTWYKMTDYYSAKAGSYLNYGNVNDREINAETPPNAASDYDFSTPDKWIFSAAAIIGQNALISVDYEISDYGNMKFPHPGLDREKEISKINSDISHHFGIANTLKIGAEVKVMPQFAVRAGYALYTTPMKKSFRTGETGEVLTAGTVTNYTLDDGSTNYYTIGLGYRFTPNFYADLACVYKTYKESVYPYSSTVTTDNNYHLVTPGTLKNNDTKVVLTLGYKF